MPRFSRYLPSCLVLLAAIFVLTSAHADEGNGELITWDQMPAKVQAQFDQARAQFSNEPRYAKVVQDAWTYFNKNSLGAGGIPQGSYPAHAVEKLQEVIKEAILGQKDQDKANQETDGDRRQEDLDHAHQHDENVKKGLTTLSLSAVAPATAGKTPGATPVNQQDIAKFTDAVRQSVMRGMSENPSGPYKPGTQTPAGALTQPSDQTNPAGLTNIALDNLFKGDPSAALSAIDKAVDLGGGSDALAVRGGIELDQNNYSKANQDALQALQLDPTNKYALTVANFSAGRTDGVATGGPAGAAVKGAGAGGAGGAGGGSDGGAGGAGGFGGSYGSGGGVSGSLASASAASGGLSPAGSASGAAAGGALSRMSGVQAQKGAQDALAMKDYGGAMAFVNRALAQNPNDPALLNLRSSIYAGEHDYKHAIQDAKAGLLLDPKNPALLRSLGFAQLRDKDFQGAMATANEMLELNPNDPYAYAIRGHAYGSMGDRDAMMSDLKRAAELDPSFAAAAAKMGGQLQLPDDKDILFLFPGEDAASPAKTAAPASGRGRSFGLLVGASALGGLLLALGLLATVLAPLKAQLTSAFTRITRTGPTVAEGESDTASPASINGIMPGLIRGQFEISRQIGVGGMGVVYAGTDRSLGRPVAIKKMREELRYDAREKARFVSEAKTVAALHHPNVVDIYAIAEDGDDVFLVFEYVDGKTVHDLLQTGGKMPAERAAQIVRASADALDYAHSRGVIHRDMKPSNVMLDQSGRVKVMDFGIARMAKDTMLRHSMTNTVVGTPPYMAPEQEQGQVRKESDVYSLAICAYEMMCGKLPFVGIGSGMLLNKINMSFIPPSSENAALPPALDPVFDRAFQADPDKRYPTPREFADALESALAAPVRAA